METPKSKRKPLQPRNQANSESSNSKLPKQLGHSYYGLSAPVLEDYNKENQCIYHLLQATPPKVATTTESTLGEELTAVRKKIERLRAEKEKTEKVLEERGRRLECEMMDILERGEFQRILELEVDRLYRLKELHSHSMRMSPVRSLRDKELDRKVHVHTRSPRPLMFPPPSPSPSSSSASPHRIPLGTKERVHTHSPSPLHFPSPSHSSSSSTSSQAVAVS